MLSKMLSWLKGNFVCFEELKTSVSQQWKPSFSLTPSSIDTILQEVKVLKKSTNKFYCLVYKIFFINKLSPSLNAQNNSIRAKVFT